jgi:hypothetical protein
MLPAEAASNGVGLDLRDATTLVAEERGHVLRIGHGSGGLGLRVQLGEDLRFGRIGHRNLVDVPCRKRFSQYGRLVGECHLPSQVIGDDGVPRWRQRDVRWL